MLVIIYLSLSVMVMLTTVLGVSANTQKKVKTWLVVSRLLYLLLLVAGGVRFFYLIPISLGLAALKIVVLIGWVGCIELGFAKKQEQRVTIPFGICLALLFIVNLILNYYF